MSLNDINSLAHTKWNCKYHVVFVPKYMKKSVLQREKIGSRKDIEEFV